MQEIKIGKDVLESLTTSMYEDHRSIYREYIQNSCDQIDKAVNDNILNSIDEGEIYINIDIQNKTIEIEDNATGIKKNKVYEILGNVALSSKDIGSERGFRGIGRLAGLGYCEELIFETSFSKEETKSIMRWNAKKFKQIINDRTHKEEASLVIQSVIDLKQGYEEKDKHYFKVILKQVTNEELLNIKNIKEYISMVAPLPFKNHFIFKSKIKEELKKDNLNIEEYKIFINSEQIFKPYKSDIKDNNNKIIDKIIDIDFIKLYDKEKQLLCWGWYGISEFNGAIKQNNIFRKIRLRKGNIQIGNENTLNKLHKENRSNSYFVGEIYAFHKDLIPNARRDYFSENETCKEFEQKLKEKFINDLYKLYYKASDIRSATKKIESFNQLQEEIKDKKEKGLFENKEELKQIEQKLQKSKLEAKKAEEKLNKIEKDFVNDKNISKIIQTISKPEKKEIIDEDEIVKIKPKFRTQTEYPKLDKKTQKIISKIYEVIDNVLTKELAENLKQKIKEKLNS
jgi:molecular chaperone HtpG